MAQIELVIFDFDGTLVDTAPDLIRATNIYLESQGVEPLSSERIRGEIGQGLRRLIWDLYPDLDKTDVTAAQRIEAEFLAVYDREFLSSPSLYPGVLEFIAEWDGQIAIVSNKRTRYIHPILKTLGVDVLPWVAVVGGDSCAHMKPHPEPLLTALDAAGTLPENALIVGDGMPDVLGALAIGSPMVGVEFGYTRAEELMELGAWKTISTYDELLPLIQSYPRQSHKNPEFFR